MSYAMQHDVDPKDDLLKKLGNVKDIEIFHNQLLCAVYIRPEKQSLASFCRVTITVLR